MNRRSLLLGLLFVSPWLIGFLAFTAYPLVASAYYSLTRYDLIRPPVFIGLDNFRELFTEDAKFWTVVRNTLIYVGLSAPLGVISAFLMASLLNTKIAGRSWFRAIFYFPSIIPVVVTAAVWQFLLNVQYGAINGFLQQMGMKTIPFLSSPDWTKPTLIMIHIWAQGGAVVTFLAALQDVPRSLHEAAVVDGANAWQRFKNITVPLCTPAILYNTVTAFIAGFQNFGFPQLLLPNGGPSASAELYTMFLYSNAFTFLRMGKASALAWLLFIVIVIFTILFFRSSRNVVHYGGE
jgi:multiple sugar transport system permease protein